MRSADDEYHQQNRNLPRNQDCETDLPLVTSFDVLLFEPLDDVVVDICLATLRSVLHDIIG
jgi:hypothetical protein